MMSTAYPSSPSNADPNGNSDDDDFQTQPPPSFSRSGKRKRRESKSSSFTPASRASDYAFGMNEETGRGEIPSKTPTRHLGGMKNYGQLDDLELDDTWDDVPRQSDACAAADVDPYSEKVGPHDNGNTAAASCLPRSTLARMEYETEDGDYNFEAMMVAHPRISTSHSTKHRQDDTHHPHNKRRVVKVSEMHTASFASISGPSETLTAPLQFSVSKQKRHHTKMVFEEDEEDEAGDSTNHKLSTAHAKSEEDHTHDKKAFDDDDDFELTAKFNTHARHDSQWKTPMQHSKKRRQKSTSSIKKTAANHVPVKEEEIESLCPACNKSLKGLDLMASQSHVNRCLDGEFDDKEDVLLSNTLPNLSAIQEPANPNPVLKPQPMAEFKEASVIQWASIFSRPQDTPPESSSKKTGGSSKTKKKKEVLSSTKNSEGKRGVVKVSTANLATSIVNTIKKEVDISVPQPKTARRGGGKVEEKVGEGLEQENDGDEDWVPEVDEKKGRGKGGAKAAKKTNGSWKGVKKGGQKGGRRYGKKAEVRDGEEKGKADAKMHENEENAAAVSKPPRIAPFWKWVDGTKFTVDAFSYGCIAGCTAYFLSHFHSDHYGGLSGSFAHGPIYCSKVTANLVKQNLRVKEEFVHALPMNTPVEIQGVTVTLIDANHCPGAVLFLFDIAAHPKPLRHLHTGDFRFHPAIHPYHSALTQLPFKGIDTLYLDTTYISPKYVFPPQDQVIQACVDLCVGVCVDGRKLEEVVAGAWAIKKGGGGLVEGVKRGVKVMQEWLLGGSKTKDGEVGKVVGAKKMKGVGKETLIVVGSYSIGKERLFKEIAKAIGAKVFCQYSKRRMLRCLEDPELDDLLTENHMEAQVHVVSMGELNVEALEDVLRHVSARFDRIIAFRPTGWTFQVPKKPSMTTTSTGSTSSSSSSDPTLPRRYTLHSLKPTNLSKQITKFGVPYSEHSSYEELKECVQILKPRKVIPTVGVGKWEEMQGLFSEWRKGDRSVFEWAEVPIEEVEAAKVGEAVEVVGEEMKEEIVEESEEEGFESEDVLGSVDGGDKRLVVDKLPLGEEEDDEEEAISERPTTTCEAVWSDGEEDAPLLRPQRSWHSSQNGNQATSHSASPTTKTAGANDEGDKEMADTQPAAVHIPSSLTQKQVPLTLDMNVEDAPVNVGDDPWQHFVGEADGLPVETLQELDGFDEDDWF
ncbi:hypothetical protein HDV05_005842 [Chytridiales sp. JEL 0842]|nr:hypothetical protein HDV05_005842 [Chytridiales sp. JEL 0842]